MILAAQSKFNTLKALLLMILLASTLVSPTYGLVSREKFYQNNGINFYSPGGATQCTAGSSGSVGIANGNTDYKGRPILKDDQLTKISEYQPVYEKASEETKIPWQIFAVVHIRETNLLKGNPGPSTDGRLQGIYQDYAQDGAKDKDNPYPTGPVDDAEFLRQTIWAGKFLKGKIEASGHVVEDVEKGDETAIKNMFFYYNGAADLYKEQAALLGFPPGPDGSPYVMNIADEKRDPAVNKDTWGQVASDNDPYLTYPARGDYGAFVMYSALAGVPSSGGACTGGSAGRAGKNGWELESMILYSQEDDPWRAKRYGVTSEDTIVRCGCGPTSMAMAVATLNNDPSVNPETMANFFTQNGYINAYYDEDLGMQVGCGTRFDSSFELEGPFGRVANEYDITVTDIGTDLANAKDAIQRGSFVFMSFGAGSDFGNQGGHIMLMRGVTDSGNYLFADPSTYGMKDGLSDKTKNENGFSADQFQSGINVMYELRKG